MAFGLVELGVIAFALVWSLMPLVTLVLAVRIDRRVARIEAALARPSRL